MSIQVRETSAGKSISAYVVLNKKGRHVATVNAHFSNSGVCTVDVWNLGDASTEASLKTALKTGAVTDKQLQRAMANAPDYYQRTEQRESWAACSLFRLQQGRGYDFGSALSGLMVDGHTLVGRCQRVPELDAAATRLLKAHRKAHLDGGGKSGEYDAKALKIGAHLANWTAAKGYGSLFFSAGLDRLPALGYSVIQAI